MKNLAREILGDEVYLFNDQIVIKLPNDRLRFEPHKDNQYGPNSDGSIHTVNMSWILDDFTEENGTLEIQNQDDGEWVTIYPKKGDIVAIHGNTYHRSGKNKTIYSRGLYACVYTESPINLEGFYTQRFL
jgi:ectoine hydroxylase-related dioxygenase (phytanoyl-CoA dioxygenase family)